MSSLFTSLFVSFRTLVNSPYKFDTGETRHLNILRWCTPSLLVAIGLFTQVHYREYFGERIFLMVYPPLLLGTVVGGFLPGLISTAIAVVGAWYWLVPYSNSFQIRSRSDLFALIGLAVTGLFATLLGSSIRFLHLRERKSYEKMLKTQDKLELALEAGGNGTWLWDIRQNTVEFDQRTQKLFGSEVAFYNENFLEVINHYIYKEDREPFKNKLEQILRTHDDFDIEFRVKNGTEKNIATHGKLVRDKNGNAVKLTGVSWDITSKITAAKEILAAEQRFRTVLESAPDALFIVDKKGAITLINRRAELLFGYSRKELIGKPVEILISHSLREGHVKLREEYVRAPTSRAMAAGRKLFAITKGGSKILVEICLSPIIDGGEFAIIADVRDMTERLKSEEQLRIFAAAVESCSDFIGICTPDMKPFFVNEAGRRMVGLDSMEAVRKTQILDYFWLEDRSMIEREAIPILTATGRWSGECRFKNFKTGEPIHTMWNAFLVKNPEGEAVAWGTISPNLNKIKLTEESLRASLEEKEVLLREIHHRVKNNLNIVSSLLELQAMSVKGDENREALIESQNRVISMALVHEKLYQSKNLAQIDFHSYVRDLVFAIYHSYGKNPELITPTINIVNANLDIDTAVPCSLIINELLSNSLKHAFPEKKFGHVWVSLKPTSECPGAFDLMVSDDGVGLPPGFQIEKVRSLGLKLVRTLTKQIGGTVLETAPSEGAAFAIRFTPKRKEISPRAA